MDELPYKGYKFTANAIGYSVYQDGVCVAAGGTFSDINSNRVLAKRAIVQLIEGKRVPLNLTK